MMRREKYRTIGFAVFLLCMCNTTSYAKKRSIYNFDYITRSDGWLESSNSAGLHGALPVRSISYAEAFFGAQNGGFVNYSGSNDSYDFGVKSESFQHFEKVSFYGKIQYRYFRGENMSGSIFVNPGEHPFDLVEFTPGAKNREQYLLSGGVGFALAKNLNGGLRIDYEADNYAKRKDLRHKNTRMGLNLSVGLVFRAGVVDLGANYLYRKNTEKVVCEQIGVSGNEYDMFFNKGIWFGESGLWTSNGMWLNEPGINGLPLKDSEQGAAVQVNIGRGKFRFFNEFSYSSHTGETGEKGTIWSHSASDLFNYKGVMRIVSGENIHLIRGKVNYVNLRNHENILHKENISDVIQTVIYGSRLIFRQRSVNAGLEYEFDWKAMEYNPLMSMRAGVDYYNRSGLGSLVYPYTRSQYVENVRFSAAWDRYFGVGGGQLKAGVGIACQIGGGDRMSQGRVNTSQPDMDLGSYSPGNEQYLNREFEFLTATREELLLGLRYTYPVGRIALPVYVDFGWNYIHAQGVKWIDGHSRNLFSLAVGCQF